MSDTHKNQQYISCYGYDSITKNHSLGSGGTPLGILRVKAITLHCVVETFKVIRMAGQQLECVNSC
jgi:hypothetical protein